MTSTRSKTNTKRSRTDTESSINKSKKRVSIFEPEKNSQENEADDLKLYIEGKKPEWDQRVKEFWIESLKTPPLAFIDDIINSVNDKMYTMLSALQQGFEKLLPDPDEVAERMVQIDVLLESAVDRNYDVFELYALKNIFAFHPKDPVPPLHYEGFDLKADPSELEKLEDELQAEREKLIGAQYFSYRATLFRNSAMKFSEEIDQLTKDLNELENIGGDFKIPTASDLSLTLLKFEKIMSRYKESLSIFKDPTTSKPTQRDMFLKISTLNHFSKLSSQYIPSDSIFQIAKQVEKIKDQSWDDIISALEL